MDTFKAYYIMVNEHAYAALCKRYLTKDVDYIFSAGMKLLKDFHIKEDDENILTAFLLYFSSIKSKAENPIDLRKARELSDLESAEILKDVLFERETDKSSPILITT